MGLDQPDQPTEPDPAYLLADHASTVLRSPGTALAVPPAELSERSDLRLQGADETAFLDVAAH
jgi:hypothetical protein